MKLQLYILTLVISCGLRLTAEETNATQTPAACCIATNKNISDPAIAKTAATNAPADEAPWSFSTTGTDDKFKDLSSGLSKSSGNGPSLWRSAGATIFVLALLLGVNYWLRKRGGGRFAGASRTERLRIVERVGIDHRRGILLIEADGERIVAAISADRIETLAVLPSKSRHEEGAP